MAGQADRGHGRARRGEPDARPAGARRPARRPTRRGAWQSSFRTRGGARAAALQAEGRDDGRPGGGRGALAEARDAWEKLGLPLDAARAEMLRVRRLADVDPEAARAAAEQVERRA